MPELQGEQPLRAKAAAGARWGAVATAVTFSFSLAQNITLSRLLEPRDFGLSGMIWTVLGLAQLFSDAGMSNVLLYRQQVRREEVSSILWLNIFASGALSLLLLASGPLIAGYFHEAALLPLMPWAVGAFFLACLGALLRTLVQKQLRFGALAVSETAAGAGALACAIVVALSGGGVYALLAASLASATLKLACSAWALRYEFPLLWHFRFQEVRATLSFGAYQLGDRIANYAWSNLDYVLIGRMLGAESLGYYRLAYETALRPLTLVNPIFNSVAYPVFARKQNDLDSMRRGYLEMISYIAVLVMPLMAGLAVAASPVVRVVFGEQWLPAVPSLRILCLLSVLRCLQNPLGVLVVARGMPRVGFLFNAGLLVLNAIAYPLAIRWGLETLAWSAVATTAVAMIAFWRPVYGDTIGLRAGHWLRRIATPAWISSVMGAIVWGVLAALPWPEDRALALGVACGALTYLGLYWLLDRNFVAEFMGMLRRRD